jgi:hypothetical protein
MMQMNVTTVYSADIHKNVSAIESMENHHKEPTVQAESHPHHFDKVGKGLAEIFGLLGAQTSDEFLCHFWRAIEAWQ